MDTWYDTQEHNGDIYWGPGTQPEFEGVDEIYFDITDYDETSPYDYSDHHRNQDEEYLNDINGENMNVFYDIDIDWCWGGYHGWYWCTDDGKMISDDTV